MPVVWGVVPCEVLEVFNISTMTLVTLMMETVSASETSVKFYQTSGPSMLEDTILSTCTLILTASTNMIITDFKFGDNGKDMVYRLISCRF